MEKNRRSPKKSVNPLSRQELEDRVAESKRSFRAYGFTEGEACDYVGGTVGDYTNVSSFIQTTEDSADPPSKAFIFALSDLMKPPWEDSVVRVIECTRIGAAEKVIGAGIRFTSGSSLTFTANIGLIAELAKLPKATLLAGASVKRIWQSLWKDAMMPMPARYGGNSEYQGSFHTGITAQPIELSGTDQIRLSAAFLRDFWRSNGFGPKDQYHHLLELGLRPSNLGNQLKIISSLKQTELHKASFHERMTLYVCGFTSWLLYGHKQNPSEKSAL